MTTQLWKLVKTNEESKAALQKKLAIAERALNAAKAKVMLLQVAKDEAQKQISSLRAELAKSNKAAKSQGHKAMPSAKAATTAKQSVASKPEVASKPTAAKPKAQAKKN